MIAILNFFLLEILAKYSEHLAEAAEFNYLIVNRSISLSLEEIYVLLQPCAAEFGPEALPPYSSTWK